MEIDLAQKIIFSGAIVLIWLLVTVVSIIAILIGLVGRRKSWW